MANPIFVYNLRPDTFNPTVKRACSPAGYLLSPKYATKATKLLAQQVRAAKYRFIVDNGNFTFIEEIRKQYGEAAHSLWLQVARLEQRLGRNLRPTDQPKTLRTAYRSLATKIQRTAEMLAGHGENSFKDQLNLNPTAIIGVENITMAAWLSVNIEPGYVDLYRSFYRSINKEVATRAVLRRRELPAPLSKAYYPVASAFSYNTAMDAGREFASKGLDRVALGFGAFMADDNWSDHIEIGSNVIAFSSRWPNRYTRTAAVAKGFWDGYKEVAGIAPKGFHFLGLGAPIMIPLVTLAGWETPDLSFDATSPIKDALQGGTMYVSKPAYLKIRNRNIAYRMSSDPTADWDCPCLFCRSFLRTYPFRREVAFRWRKATNAREVTAEDLRPGGKLFGAFSLFSEPGAGRLRNDINQARVGHNHWVIDEVMAELRGARTNRQIQGKVDEIITRYAKYSKGDQFTGAVRFAYKLIAER